MTIQERDEKFFEWARDEIMVALRMMRKDNEPIHAFDFDGTTNGVKEPWSIMLLIAPKDHVDKILTALQFLRQATKEKQ